MIDSRWQPFHVMARGVSREIFNCKTDGPRPKVKRNAKGAGERNPVASQILISDRLSGRAHISLLKGDVFTAELIDTYISCKRKNESEAIRLRAGTDLADPWKFLFSCQRAVEDWVPHGFGFVF